MVSWWFSSHKGEGMPGALVAVLLFFCAVTANYRSSNEKKGSAKQKEEATIVDGTRVRRLFLRVIQGWGELCTMVQFEMRRGQKGCIPGFDECAELSFLRKGFFLEGDVNVGILCIEDSLGCSENV